MPLLILVAAFDVLGANTSTHLGGNDVDISVTLPVTLGVDTSSCAGKARFEGNDGDALKLSQIVGARTNVASIFQRICVTKNEHKMGKTINVAASPTLRFQSSQFFHSNTPSCAAFDAMLPPLVGAAIYQIVGRFANVL